MNNVWLTIWLISTQITLISLIINIVHLERKIKLLEIKHGIYKK
jgi:hypothetical protein